MVEFRTMYYGPMDREYHQAVTETPQPVAVEEPIFTIDQLGETVPEHDPTGRFKNIIQTTQAAIRGGAGTVQLVLMTPPESAIGGRPKAYGKEVRETLKEVALANKVNIAGVELPTGLNNLSGFDYQNLVFSDEKRKNSLDEVKDAIRFAADVGQGGGVDIVSWEFPRGVNEAPWQEKDPLSKGKFEQVGEQRIGWLVDRRTGRTVQFRKDEIQHLPYDPTNFKELEQPKPGEKLELKKFTWEDFKRWKDVENEKRARENKPLITAEELYVAKQLEGQIKTAKGWQSHNEGQAEMALREKERIEKALKEGIDPETKQKLTEKNREVLENEKNRLEDRRKDFWHSAYGQAQQAAELEERRDNLKPIEDYALWRSTRTYAEAGMEAMRTYEQGRAKGTITKPLYVGPEIGWPGYYGSHPEEFIKIVKKSREEMINLITKPTMKVPDSVKGETEVKNPYWDPTINREQAKELADKHIKGLFDTSHMGMWLAHFKPETDPQTNKPETEDRRMERFKKWYLDEVKKIADAGVVGGIQLVDSMSAAHGHLPPGEGIFPVFEAAKIFKEKGFSGFLVSEGHEEEKFGEGRIRMKTWQHGGAGVGAGYFSGPPMRWGQVTQAYFGRTYSPMFMFGGYAPSNEFKLWSEVPLE